MEPALAECALETAGLPMDSAYRKTLDALSKIREVLGSHGELALPQLCAIGDQSSGKSSLLECLTGVQFPVKSGLCTRVPTVVQGRRHPEEVVEIRAGTGEYAVIDSARVGDNITSLQEELMRKCAPGVHVSHVQITVRIFGPTLQDYDVVDLPGIIHNGDGQAQTLKLIDNYIARTQTLILVVSEAKQDKELTAALKAAEKHDPEAKRTLRILTKFDFFDNDETKARASELIVNGDEETLGPHAVVCRTRGRERYAPDDEADSFEEAGIDARSRGHAGVEALKSRLPPLYVELIRTNLPTLERDALAVRKKAEADLHKLGDCSLGATQMILEAQRVLGLPAHSFQCAVTPAMHELRDALHKTETKIDECMVKDCVKHDAFASPFFQGEEAFRTGMGKICEWWRPLFDRFAKEIASQLAQSLRPVRADAVGVSERLCTAIDAEWDRTSKVLVATFRKELDAVLQASREYGTINHYLVQQYFSTHLANADFERRVAEALVPTEHRTVNVSQDQVREAIRSVRDSMATEVRQDDLDQYVSHAVLNALKANWTVEKKTVTDLVLKTTRDAIIAQRTLFVHTLICNVKLQKEAVEDDDVQQRRSDLHDTLGRMDGVLLELRELRAAIHTDDADAEASDSGSGPDDASSECEVVDA